METLISIIVIIYRVEAYLHQCIDSILEQTYKNLEIILVDDGSDDMCPQICDEYAAKDRRVKVIHKKNGGADSARKAGIQIATGKYIGYVDGDDWIESDMYEKLISYAQKFGVSVVESGIIDSIGNNFSERYSMFENGVYKGADFERTIEPYILYSGEFFKLGIMASMCNKLYKKEAVYKYQMLPEPSDNVVEDTFCAIPCVAEAKSLYVTHESFYHYRKRLDSVKHTVRTDFVDIILKCYPEWINRFPFVKDKNNIKKQIQYYLMYILLMKAPYVFDGYGSERILEAYGGINKNDKVVLYGAGAVGVQLHHYLKTVLGEKFVLWADRNYENLSMVGNPQDMLEMEFDYVVIGILWAESAKSAKQSLIDMGIPENKILWIEKCYIEEPGTLLSKIEGISV